MSETKTAKGHCLCGKIDEKPEYYCFSNKTINMTGEEAFAEYSP